jgi:DUF1365 family protein
MIASALYLGSVVHTRLRPLRHRLRYRMPWFLIDLDELPDLAKHLRLFSVNRFNLFAFHEDDHGSTGSGPLRPRIEQEMRQAGVIPDGGAIRVLTMPRVLGRSFNPISVFFCHNLDGNLRAVLYEVNNTFGTRHTYVVPTAAATDGPLRQACAKRLHVSPFMDMDMTYSFRVAIPGERAMVAIEARDAGGLMLSAAYSGRRRDLTDGNLLAAFLRFPLLATQVLGAIHWEALKLWLKGMRFRPTPVPPTLPSSIGVTEAAR